MTPSELEEEAIIVSIKEGRFDVFAEKLSLIADVDEPLVDGCKRLIHAVIDECPKECRLQFVQALVERGMNPMNLFMRIRGDKDIAFMQPLWRVSSKNFNLEFEAMLKSDLVDLLDRDDNGYKVANRSISIVGMNQGIADRLNALQSHFERDVLPSKPGMSSDALWRSSDSKLRTPAMKHSNATAAIAWMLDHPSVRMQEWIDQVDGSGQTLLSHACNSHSMDTIRMLLSRGASMEVHGSAGWPLIENQERRTREAFSEANVKVLSMLNSFKSSRDASRAIESALAAAKNTPGLQS